MIYTLTLHDEDFLVLKEWKVVETDAEAEQMEKEFYDVIYFVELTNYADALGNDISREILVAEGRG